MECEICGAETNTRQTIMVEGARMDVCAKCASRGARVDNAPGVATYIKKKHEYRPEEDFEIVPDYARQIQAARSAKGWKQDDLARAIREPVSVVNHLESGKSSPTRELCKKLEQSLGLKLIQSAAATLADKIAVEKQSGPARGVTLGDIVTIRKR